MSTALTIKSGSKLFVAVDVPIGKEPIFDMTSTFGKPLDESAFLMSIPMRNGQRLEPDENQKFLIRYGQGDNAMIVAGYVDDVVKEGLRTYWKIRRVTEQRQFFTRAEERLKVSLRVEYRQDTWPVNEDGKIEAEEGMTLDISGGGAAIYLNRRFEIGEVCELSLPHIGTSEKGRAIEHIVSVVCWVREAPKGSLYRNVCGLQFRFADGEEQNRVKEYVANLKKKYKL